MAAKTNHETRRERSHSSHTLAELERESASGNQWTLPIGPPHFAFAPEARWRELWLTVTPIWIVLALSRIVFYGLERLRHPDIIPPVSVDAILMVIFCPLVVAGSYLILRSWQKSGLALMAAVAFGSTLLVGGVALPVHAIISADVFNHAGARAWLAAAHATTPEFWQSWLATAVEYGVLYLSSILLVVGFLSYRSLMNEHLLRAWAEASAARERSRALRMQLNPHFLFNTLNSIAGATFANPATAQELVARLSEVLRRTMLAGEQDMQELQDELRVVEAYAHMEQIRTQSRVRWRSQIDPRCSHAAVPSLLLLPLIENAVKHGLRGNAREVTIDVTVSHHSDDLEIMIFNTLPSPATDSHALLPGGLGLRNVRERLKMLFGTRATLATAQPTSSQFEVRVTLPYRESAGLTAC